MTAAPARRRTRGRTAATAALAAALLLGSGVLRAQGRGALPTGPTTGPVTMPPAAPQQASEPPEAVPTEPDKVHVRRLSDVVAVREGARAAERVLYYFNPDLMLAQGDHVEQGSGGQSVVTFPGSATMEMHATAHAEFARLSAEGDVVRFPLLTRLEAGVLDRPLDLILPGGTQVHLVNTTLRVEVEPGRLSVRNTGSNPVPVHGDLRLHRSTDEAAPTGLLELQPGEEVIIPLFRVEGSETGTVTDLWGLLTVRHHRGLKLEPEGDQLHLQRTASPDGVVPAGDAAQVEEASVGGVTTRWLPGSTLVVLNPRHVQPPAAPAAPTPAAAAPAVPAAPPAKPAGEQPAPAGEKPAPAPADAGGAPPDQPPSPPKPSEAPKLPAGKESRS